MDSYEDASGVIAATVRGLGIRFSIGVPISRRGQTWGVMIATSKAAERRSRPRWRSRLQDFTELVATAISNATARRRGPGRWRTSRGPAPGGDACRRGRTRRPRFRGDRARGRSTPRRARHAHGPIRGGCGDQRRRLERGRRPPAGRHAGRLDGTNVASLVFRSGRPARIDGYSPPTGATGNRLRGRMSIYSSVATPIVVDGRLWGLMIASSRRAVAARRHRIQAAGLHRAGGDRDLEQRGAHRARRLARPPGGRRRRGAPARRARPPRRGAAATRALHRDAEACGARATGSRRPRCRLGDGRARLGSRRFGYQAAREPVDARASCGGRRLPVLIELSPRRTASDGRPPRGGARTC